MNAIRVLVILAFGTFLWTSCGKDPIQVDELTTQDLQIDMQQYNGAALLALGDGKFDLLPLGEGPARAEDLRLVLRAAHQGSSPQWIFSSPADPQLDSVAMAMNFPTRPQVSLRELSASVFNDVNPQTKEDLAALFGRAKAVVPDASRTRPINPDTVVIAKDSDGNVYAVVIKVCVEGDSWYVCIEIRW